MLPPALTSAYPQLSDGPFPSDGSPLSDGPHLPLMVLISLWWSSSPCDGPHLPVMVLFSL